MPIKKFQTYWLDCVVDGHPIKEWYQHIKHEPTKARCTYCNVIIKFDVNGLTTFKRHALSVKHRENRKAAHLRRKKISDFSGEYFKPQETIDALALLYPGMNFNCSVDLFPLSVLYNASKQAGSSDFVSFLRHLIKPEARNAFIDVYICFFCGVEFVSRQTLHGHQKECGMKPPDLQSLMHHGKSMHHTPPPKLCQSSEERMFSALASAKRQTTICPYVPPSKDSFISALGLLPKKKAAHVSNRRRNTECEVIDLDEDTPISPTLPRTPKLLLSHLSRDGNENNGDNSSPCKVRRSLFSCQNSQTEKETNAKKERSDENNKEESNSKEKNRISHAKSLYSLDVTSPLGQLVIKHFKGDPNLHVLSDVESHCLTSTPKKTAPFIQLRERHNIYPVTFKCFSGKFTCSFVHQYKFTRQQKVEFLRRVNTGLDKRSRVLLSKMKHCKVRLTRITKADLKRWMLSTDEVTVNLKPLSADEIKYWTSPKEVVDLKSDSAVFPSGLTFSSPNVNNVLGLKTCQDSAFNKKYNLTVANYVSEETYAEVTENRRAVYKSLLSDSAGCEGSLLESENSQQVSSSIIKQILSSPCLQTRFATGVQTLQENTNINMTHNNISSSSFCYNQIDKDIRKDANNACDFVSSVNRSMSHPKNTLMDSYTPVPSTLSNFPNLKMRVVSTENQEGEFVAGPYRSGIHNVQIRTACEGEMIKSSVKNLKLVSGSKECVSKSEISRTRKRNYGENRSFIMKSFITSHQISASNMLRKDCLKNSGFKSKKRKVDSVIDKTDISLTSASTVNGSDRKFSVPGGTLSCNLKFARTATNMFKDSVQSLIVESLCPSPDPEIKSNTPQVRTLERVQHVPETVVSSTFVEGIGRQHKRGVVSKPVGYYKKFATVGPFGSNNLLNSNKDLSAHSNIYSRSFFQPCVQQEEKSVTTHEKLLRSPNPDAFSNDRNRDNAVNNCSLINRVNQTSHINHTVEVAEIKNAESKSAILYANDNRSKKTVQEIQNSLAQTNISSNHVSWNHSLVDSKLISQKDIAPTELRFVTYSSSPVSSQLRRSSLMNTISISRKAEERKSQLTSFLLQPNGKTLSTLLIKKSLIAPSKSAEHTEVREKFKQTSSSRTRK